MSALRRIAGLAPGGLRRSLTPFLGHLEQQYEPRLLRVPAAYARTAPPGPAPRIALVTPVRNGRRFVAETVQSVLAQGYPNLCYRVIDGWSTDGTLRAVEPYLAELDGVETRRDHGQASAINRGLSDADGEILAWLNADDLLLPGALSFVGSYFAAHPEVDVVYGHRVLIDVEGRDIGRWLTPRHSDASLLWFDFVPQETAFWRRWAWEAVGGVDTDYELAFDWDLFLRLREAGAVFRRLPRFLGAFRQHGAQKTRMGEQLALEETARIRARRHGRPVSLEEAQNRVAPLLLRSRAHECAHRLRARLAPRGAEVSFAGLSSLPAQRDLTTVN